MWRAGAVGGARYTAAIAGGWAGALMKKLLAKRRKSKWETDRRTNRLMD